MATRTIGFAGTPSNLPVSAGVEYLATGLASGSFVAPSSGAGTKVYVYTPNYGTLAGTVGIYTFNGTSYDLIASQAFSISGTAGYVPITLSEFTIASGTAYYVALAISNGAGGWGYDVTSGNTCERKSSTTLPNPWNLVGGESRAYVPAVYLEYEESGGASIVPILVHNLCEQGAL